MYKNRIFLLLMILSLGLGSWEKAQCQNVLTETERNYYLNVKQFNEFVDRFNYKTDFRGKLIDSEFKTQLSRKEYLGLLFNAGDERLNEDSPRYSADYIDLKSKFIDEVVSSDMLINKYSLKIIAEAKCKISYQNKSQDISLFLNQEIVDNGVKWVLLGVKADFLNVLQSDTATLRFIPPTSNETNFISLKRVADDASFQHYYANAGFEYDPLSVFFFALNTGLVQFQYVQDITYHIFEIENWIIQVSEFKRNTENSGWLIDDLSIRENSFGKSLEEMMHY